MELSELDIHTLQLFCSLVQEGLSITEQKMCLMVLTSFFIREQYMRWCGNIYSYQPKNIPMAPTKNTYLIAAMLYNILQMLNVPSETSHKSSNFPAFGNMLQVPPVS